MQKVQACEQPSTTGTCAETACRARGPGRSRSSITEASVRGPGGFERPGLALGQKRNQRTRVGGRGEDIHKREAVPAASRRRACPPGSPSG